MRKKKYLKRILLAAAGFIVILLAAAYVMFAERLHCVMSVRKLQDDLYCMEYKGDYGFDRFLEQGGASSDSKLGDYLVEFISNGFYKKNNAEVDRRTFGCSALKAKAEDGRYLYGRNYDWEPCKAMIIHTVPKNGYESVSTNCMNFMGFGNDYVPEGIGNRFLAIATIYVPLDGMNEKGVVIAELMNGDREETHQDTEKPDITTLAAIRMVLDHAASVDEAVKLISEYDMNSAIESAHHYYIADASGKSVTVEYIDNEMIVTKTNMLTNHYLAEKKRGIGSQNSRDRFDRLTEQYQAAEGCMSMEELTEQMKAVSCGMMPDPEDPTEKTDWTCCYDTKNLTVDFYFMENYNQKYTIELGEKEHSQSSEKGSGCGNLF